MFDFLTRRRLIFGLISCLFVTISFLFITRLHSRIIRHVVPSYSQTLSSNNSQEEKVNTCYQTESIDVLKLCQACSAFERRSAAAGCSLTGYREYLLCKTSKVNTYRSCPIPKQIQKQQFWAFEGTIFFLALFAIAAVQTRQRTLDKQMVEKIKKQIGESDE